MEIEKLKLVIEAILFAAGREVKISEIASSLELTIEDVTTIIENMRLEYDEKRSGIEIIKINDGYQMCTRKEYYEYIYPIFDKRNKPNLSQASLESLAIIAYNPGITRAEIEAIRGVNSDATIYKLLEYNLIQEAGRLDAPGRPTTYQTSSNFLKMFGYTNLDELPELPRYKMDENQQIVIDDILEEQTVQQEKEIEAPMPERETKEENSEQEKLELEEKDE